MSSRQVYGVSVDSRSRNASEPDNRYTVNLYRTLDRVKTIQLGSFQYKDCRDAFDGVSLRYSEPLFIPPHTYLRLQEIVTTSTKQARTESVRHVSVLIPPTLNRITAVAGDVVTTEHPPGLNFGCRYYHLAGVHMHVVGADFPQDLAAFVTPAFPTVAGPVLTAATVVSPYHTFTYAPNYLTELSGGVGNTDLRHVGATYHSYVYAPRLTLVELFTMLNAACHDLTTRVDLTDAVVSATNTSPIVVTTANANDLVSGDEVVITNAVGNTAANGTWFIERVSANTFTLVNSAGNGVYTGGGSVFSPQRLHVPVKFGFHGEDASVRATAPPQVVESAGATVTRQVRLVGNLAALLGFNDVRLDPFAVASVPAIRAVPLKSGTLLANEVVQHTQYRLREGNFMDENEENRTLYFNLQLGTLQYVVLPYGQYSGVQLAAYLTARLRPYQIRVDFDAANGTFTMTQEQGLTFTLDFVSSSELMCQRLGFDARVYSGHTAYTSERRTVYGTSCPQNDYAVTLDDATQHVTFHTHAPVTFHTVQGTSTPGVTAEWHPFTLEHQPLAHHLQPGDVLTATRPALSSTQAGAKPITAVTNTTPIAVSVAGHGLINGDNVTLQYVAGNTGANGTWVVDNVTLNTFELVASRGNGTYTPGTGEWWSNVTAGVPSPVYTVVVQQVWDASTAVPLLTLHPTASIFSVEDVGVRQALGTPGTTDARIILKCARRNVFMLHFEHPDGSPKNFGFPVVAWPPNEKTQLSPSTVTITTLRQLPTYDAATLCIPVASSYTAPFPCNLLPPDYLIIVLRATCASQDIQSHSYRGTSFPIFAKLLITYPYTSVSQEMMFTTFAGHARCNSMIIEFQNPDGTLVNFNGRPHTFTLLFTVEENNARLLCI